jgi:adenylate kinase family enzyme
MSRNNFDIIILIGRPAAGKSEVIDFLKKTPAEERSRRFHIAPFEEIDDFLYVWETFEMDDILSRHGRKRVWTDEKYWFNDEFVWNLYIERINLAYRKRLAADPSYHTATTALVEFARGGENGFAEAFSYLHEEILKRAVIVYISVTYEESVRKNRRRARPGMEDSILYHSLPDEKMEFYYRTNDWEKLAARDARTIDIKGFKVPYAVFQNMPEKTDNPATLGAELERVTADLWPRRPQM